MNQNLAPIPVTQSDLAIADHMLAQAGHYPSAIAALDVQEILASGVDPFLPLTAAVLTDCKRPVSDLRGYLNPAAYSEVERYMAACVTIHTYGPDAT